MNMKILILVTLATTVYGGSIHSGKYTANLPNCGQSLQVYEGDKIVGGRYALREEMPWQVSVRSRNWLRTDFHHVCGGSLINERYVVTAAHCVQEGGPGAFEVLVGAFNFSAPSGHEAYHKVSKIILHPDYTPGGVDHDIALLQLESPVTIDLSLHVNIICLPETDEIPTGLTTVSGWGHVKEGGQGSDTLKAVDLPIVSQERCVSIFGADLIKSFMLCAGHEYGGQDSCQTDSGGPMIQRRNKIAYLVGVVSFGFGCGRPNSPGIYTRAHVYTDWVRTVAF